MSLLTRLWMVSARLAGTSSPVAIAGRLGIEFRLPLRLGLGPAFLADQRHEGHGAEIFLLETVLAGAAHADQSLESELTYGHDQAAADRELLLQRLGDVGTAGGDDDGLERRFLDASPWCRRRR